MKLIADSGSTRTSWRSIDDNGLILQFSTNGMNPYFTDQNAMDHVLATLTSAFNFPDPKKIKEICFYGSGCSTEEKSTQVVKALSAVFTSAKIEVASDILGAARGTCGHQPGIAAILGTGSNSCEYDGEKIISSQTSLGFILGDEGSGSHLGKTLLRKFFYGEMPEHLSSSFAKKTGHLSEVLEHIYKKPFPNRYIASFARFLQHHIDEAWCKKLVYDCFTEFLETHILKYNTQHLPLHVSGSVGFYFGNILTAAAREREIKTGSVLESPIAGLVLYHLGEI